MKRRFIIEHIPTGKKWESDWEETMADVKQKAEFEVDLPDNIAVVFPSDCRNVSIPPAILKKCVIAAQYSEE